MQINEPVRFPIAIDNTMRGDYISCPAKFGYARLLNLSSQATPIHLHAGGVFARGCEIFRKAFYGAGRTHEQALLDGIVAMVLEWGDPGDIPTWSWEYPDARAASARNKSLDRLIIALGAFFEEYNPATDHITPVAGPNGPAVEFTFAIPIPGTSHPDTGEPILYAGRFDFLGEYSGALFGEDDKTTGSLGATWAEQWQLRAQFTGYTWAAREYGYPLSGFIIRGIAFLAKSINFAEAITYRPQWEVDRWLAQLQRDTAGMVEAYTQNSYDHALSDACNAYGGCPYRTLCKTNTPEKWFDAYYTRRVWDPLDISHERIFDYE